MEQVKIHQAALEMSNWLQDDEAEDITNLPYQQLPRTWICPGCSWHLCVDQAKQRTSEL